MAALYVLHESALGYSLFHVHGLDKVGPGNRDAVRSSAFHLNQFQQVVKLVAFSPFKSTHDALTQYNAIAEEKVTDELRNFLELSLPEVKEGENATFVLGTGVHYIALERKIRCRRDEFVDEILRGVRFHLDKFIKVGDLDKAQLDLGRSYKQAIVEGVAPDVMASAIGKKDVDANAPEEPTTEEEKKREKPKLVDKATENVKVIPDLCSAPSCKPMAALYVLHESALGYSLFHVHGLDKVGPGNRDAVRLSAFHLNQFQQVVKLVAFSPFKSTHDALTQYNAVAKEKVTDELRNFLELSLPEVKEGENAAFVLGTGVNYIALERKIRCRRDEFVDEILRGVRFHLDKFIKAGDLDKAQLDLGRSYKQAIVEGVAPDVMTSAIGKKDANAPEEPTTEEKKKKEKRKLVDKATENVKVVRGLDGKDGTAQKKRNKEEYR